MKPGPLDFIPGYREAEDRYRQENAEAFAGVEPNICGKVEVLPFTPRMYIELEGGGNAMFAEAGTPIPGADVAVFLWRVSPYFDRKNEDLKRFHTARSGVLPYHQAVAEITAYIRRAWAGMPMATTRGDGSLSLVQWPATLVHLFAKEYGWVEDYTLNLPFRRLWQYANRILEEQDPKYKERSSAAMRVRTDWLTAQNAPNGNN